MTWHDMTWHDMTWHDMTWHNMTRQDKTRQDKTRQDKTYIHTDIQTYGHTDVFNVFIYIYIHTYLCAHIHVLLVYLFICIRFSRLFIHKLNLIDQFILCLVSRPPPPLSCGIFYAVYANVSIFWWSRSGSPCRSGWDAGWGVVRKGTVWSVWSREWECRLPSSPCSLAGNHLCQSHCHWPALEAGRCRFGTFHSRAWKHQEANSATIWHGILTYFNLVTFVFQLPSTFVQYVPSRHRETLQGALLCFSSQSMQEHQFAALRSCNPGSLSLNFWQA